MGRGGLQRVNRRGTVDFEQAGDAFFSRRVGSQPGGLAPVGGIAEPAAEPAAAGHPLDPFESQRQAARIAGQLDSPEIGVELAAA